MRSPLKHRTLLGVIAGVIGLASTGCGGEACGGAEQAFTEGAPEITRMEFQRQLEGDPWMLIFSVDFYDPDGDLAGGKAELYLGQTKSNRAQILEKVFDDRNLPHDATVGRLGLPVRFVETMQDNQKVRLGVRLLDAAQNASNCYELALRFQVQDR